MTVQERILALRLLQRQESAAVHETARCFRPNGAQAGILSE